MQTGKHKEAVRHFKAAAEDNNAAAVFNLGICHEMGLGTSQDFKKVFMDFTFQKYGGRDFYNF